MFAAFRLAHRTHLGEVGVAEDGGIETSFPGFLTEHAISNAAVQMSMRIERRAEALGEAPGLP
jgi:hypothetical protein